MPNRENACAITSRSGKSLEEIKYINYLEYGKEVEVKISLLVANLLKLL
jgi:hypothetical protein